MFRNNDFITYYKILPYSSKYSFFKYANGLILVNVAIFLALCSLLGNRHFREMHHFHLQG
jgi:hypothetical protein